MELEGPPEELVGEEPGQELEAHHQHRDQQLCLVAKALQTHR